MVDANILQGAIFHEDDVEDLNGSKTSESVDVDSQNKNADDLVNSHEVRQLKSSVKPAAHRVKTQHYFLLMSSPCETSFCLCIKCYL